MRCMWIWGSVIIFLVIVLGVKIIFGMVIWRMIDFRGVRAFLD